MAIKSLWKTFIPLMMISIMSNNECRDHDVNKKTNNVYKLNIWMLSEIYDKLGYITSDVCWRPHWCHAHKGNVQINELNP